jgi:hypothetical protein
VAVLALLCAFGLASFLLLRRHPLELVVAGLAMHCLLPSILVVSRLQVARFSIHPGAALVIAGLISLILLKRDDIRVFAERWLECTAALIGLAALGVVHGVTTGGAPSLGFAFDQIVVPMCAVFVIGVELTADPGKWTRLRDGILAIAAVEGVYASLQARQNSPILFAEALSEQAWFGTASEVRWMGSLDHPLVLAVILATAMPLLATVRRWYVVFPLMVIYFSGILATESRAGLLAIAGTAAYALLRGRTSPRSKSVLILASVGFVAFALQSGMVDGALERFVTGEASTQARVKAADYFFSILDQYLWLGEGLEMSFRVAAGGGLTTSFENSVFMTIVDMGLPSALFYYGLMIALLVTGLVRRSMPGFVIGGVVTLIQITTFSALGVRSAAALWIWVVAAGAAFSPRHAPPARRILPSAPPTSVFAAEPPPAAEDLTRKVPA